MANILIAEHEEANAELMARTLGLAGHECASVKTGPAALEWLKTRPVDLVLADVRLPGAGGIALLPRRPDKSVPVLLLAEKSNLADRLLGMRRGAADYIVKPFEISELVFRVTAALRKAGRYERRFCLDGLTVDMETSEAWLDGAPVELTPQEYSLLETLIINRNLALSREKLLELAWGFEYAGKTRTVDVHVQKLRKKLCLEKRIKTVYKLGYRLETLA